MARLLAAGALTVSLLVTPALQQAGPGPAASNCPRVFAHRTAALYAPENTLPGIDAAAAQGARGVEMDVQWSSSDFPILMHDPTVDRTTDGTGTPASLSLSQLRALDAADYAPWNTDPRFAGVHVPYGWEFMHQVSADDLDVLLDIHAAPTADGMARLAYYIGLFGWAGRTVLMGSQTQVQAMRDLQPTLRYLIIEYPPSGRIYTVEALASSGATGYAVPYDRATGPLVGYLHAAGLTAYTWTSDQPAYDTPINWRAAGVAGVDVLVTNQPARAITDQTGVCTSASPSPTS